MYFQTLLCKKDGNILIFSRRIERIRRIPANISSAIYFFLTIFRLYKYTRGKQYDLFITDDLLAHIGKLRKTPSIVFNDDDISIVKKFALVLSLADYILSPLITDVGRFSFKKISFPGYKDLHIYIQITLIQNIEIVKKFNPEMTPYFILRLVSLTAYHDVGIKGLSNENVKRLISLLEKKGKVSLVRTTITLRI